MIAPFLNSFPRRVVVFNPTGRYAAAQVASMREAGTNLVAGIALGRGAPYFVGVLAVTALLGYEHAIVGKGNLARIDKAFFDINGYVAVAFFAMTAIDAWLRA